MASYSSFQTVVTALFIRELKTRFGESKFGYVWILLEPLSHIVLMLIVFSVIMGTTISNIPFSLFLVTGMIPFFLFKNIVMNLMNGISANKALFAYQPVKPIAVYAARSLLEAIIYFTIFVLILGMFWWFGLADATIGHPFEILLAFIMIVLFGISMGIPLSIAVHSFPSLKLVVSVGMTILYFASAILYPVWMVPSPYLEYLEYNPLLHLIELFRDAFFQYYPNAEGISYASPVWTMLFLGYIGMWFYMKREQFLKS